MAKRRYHQSKRARAHERSAMKLHHDVDKLHHEEAESHRRHGHHLSHAESEKMLSAKHHSTHHDPVSHHSYRHHGGAEHYAGAEPRRHQEMRDAGMIHEDPRAVANMPQHVEYKPYPSSYGYLPEDLDDTIHGIDEQISADDHQRMRNFKPHKY